MMAPSEQAPIPVAVIGVGHFGRYHALHYAKNPRAKLVAVIDTDEARRNAVAAETGAEPGADYLSLIGRVAAVSIAVPTPLHFELAQTLIRAGIHVLVEKPITDTLSSAVALTNLAAERGTILQVGHVERYSSAFRVLSKIVDEPLYCECYRISPWKQRGVEVNVILDLMIHDIDMILGVMASPTVDVTAVGTAVLSKRIDLANARITFESGCVANTTASRVSYKTERRIRIFQRKAYINCDLGESKISTYSLRGDPLTQGLAAIAMETYEIPKEDSLANEIEDFLQCIATGRKPMVDGHAACEAVRVATMIDDSIREHLSNLRLSPSDLPE
jgi:predicted dehydrogenase